MTLLADAKILQFSKVPGDTKITNRVQLDNPGPSYALTLRWLPQAELWILDLYSTAGVTIVSSAWVLDRTDALLGVSTPGRPKGAIMSYDPLGRGNPGLEAWTTGGHSLYYIPSGLIPSDFSRYRTAVA